MNVHISHTTLVIRVIFRPPRAPLESRMTRQNPEKHEISPANEDSRGARGLHFWRGSPLTSAKYVRSFRDAPIKNLIDFDLKSQMPRMFFKNMHFLR